MNFNLTAAGGAGYTGTPSGNFSGNVAGTPTAGTIGGSFAVAVGGTASGTFYYSEVGNIGLSADAVRDTAFTATGDAHVDTLIFAEGRATGVLVNSADDPARCDFFLPAVIRRGDLAIAVSTGGSSPALARVMREELQAMVGEDYTLLMEIAAAVRREARSHSRVFTGDQWTSALKEPTFRQYVRAGQRDAAVVRLRMVLGLEEQ